MISRKPWFYAWKSGRQSLLLKLPRLNARAIINALQHLGFEVQRQSGSHVILKHSLTGMRAVVPEHGGRDIPVGSLAHILKEAGVNAAEFIAKL